MAITIIMPRQGQSVDSCIISKWFKKKGDKVSKGEVIFQYETDKATFDLEAPDNGTILEIFHGEGDDVPVLNDVCIIGAEGEYIQTSGTKPEAAAVIEEKTPVVEAIKDSNACTEQKINTAASAANTNNGRIKISPRARMLAQSLNIDYSSAEPTGFEGRIVEADIIRLKEKLDSIAPVIKEETKSDENNAAAVLDRQCKCKVDAADYEEIPLTNIRKVIAKSMLHSISSTAQLTLNTTFDATDILAFRKKIKENREKLGLEDITLNDIFLYAVSRTLLNHKTLNAHFLEDKMHLYKGVNLGIAVDTERGLMVPTLFDAHQKSLNEISKEAKQLARNCQKGTISPDLLKGGSFTITNLGSLGIESFTPVLNPPQVGILGVNTIIYREKEINGKFEHYPAITLSLTFDHRAIDGAPSAKFLQELKFNLENFSVLFAK